MQASNSNPGGLPGDESLSIGNDPLSGATTDHDVEASHGAPLAAPPGAGPGEPLAPKPADRSVVAADIFYGDPLVNSEGEMLGRILQVMVDLRYGCLAYVVVEQGPYTGGPLCAIPWTAFEIDARALRLRLSSPPQDLRQAPNFPREKWPPMTEDPWVEQVHSFFACRPYWSTDA